MDEPSGVHAQPASGVQLGFSFKALKPREISAVLAPPNGGRVRRSVDTTTSQPHAANSVIGLRRVAETEARPEHNAASV
jgi:hypothetical protein